MSKMMLAVLIGLLLGMALSPAPASADGGLVDSAHRIAVALEKMVAIAEKRDARGL
jgi:hypothetical protein